MDSQLLHDLIEHPEKATIEQALLVHEIVVKYPYFQAARVLHLKLLSINDYPAFVKQLPLVATYAGDRRKLFYYINPQKKQITTVPQEDNLAQIPKPEIKPKEVDTHVEEKSVENIEQDFKVVGTDNELDTSLNEQEVTQSSISETLSFAQWLDNLASAHAESHQKEQKEVKYTIEEEKVEMETETSKSVDGLTNERWSLIDSFLREYKPSAPKVELHESEAPRHVVDLSVEKPSVEKEIITETLAEIFLAQKNFTKAIEIFEKLRLKYPEKNTYFAGLIKKAKKQNKKEHKKTK